MLPNAGLPETRGDETYFPLEPAPLADWIERFVTEFGVNIIGGCCGTTAGAPAGGRRTAFDGKKPAKRTPKYLPAVSSLLSRAGTASSISGRCSSASGRTPTARGSSSNSSKRKTGTGSTEMAKEQEREGVHVLDVCVDYVGRDGVRDMKEVIKRYNEVLTKPIMLDSTEVPVIEAGLKLCSGKALIN